MLPSFESYGKYTSSNYGAHCLVFSDSQGNHFYFSYKTLVAFYSHKTKLVVRQNDWGPTTGKHLNWIDKGNENARLSGEAFNKLYNETFSN